jgi:transcriptional regulator with XRE-family HTH domain
MMAIAKWVRAERQRLGLRREDIEDLCGVSVSTVHRIERAHESVAIGSVRAVVEALGGTLEVQHAGHRDQ